MIQLLVILVAEPDNAQQERILSRLKISRRTFFRDLKLWRMAGVNIDYEAASGRYRVQVDWQSFLNRELNSWPLSTSEAAGLLALIDRADCPRSSGLDDFRIRIYVRIVKWLTRYAGADNARVLELAKRLAESDGASLVEELSLTEAGNRPSSLGGLTAGSTKPSRAASA